MAAAQPLPFPSAAERTRSARPAFDIAELDACVHCGLCLNACPTYRVLGIESESPRGRIHLVRAAGEGRIEVNDLFASHLQLCLMCRACETACPSGVHYGRIGERAREVLGPPGRGPSRRLLRTVLRRVMPSPGLLRLAALGLFLYQRLGLAGVAGFVLPRRLRDMQRMLPRVPLRAFGTGRTYPALGERRARVGLLAGCVMSVFFPDVQDATVRVLRQYGCEVVVPAGQICCGALNSHNGEAESARAMARRNIDAFLPNGPGYEFDAIIVNAAGCGAAMKAYDYLLGDDPAYAERGRNFAALTRDVTEFLADLGPRPARRTLPHATVTYQDPCHLVHGQRVRNQPRALLRGLGANLVEMEGADRCCGSAGIYNLTHPDMSLRLLQEKMEAIRATGAQVVVAPNPGCMLQLRYGAQRFGVPVRVMHLVDLLDQAHGG